MVNILKILCSIARLSITTSFRIIINLYKSPFIYLLYYFLIYDLISLIFTLIFLYVNLQTQLLQHQFNNFQTTVYSFTVISKFADYNDYIVTEPFSA
nr:hypothetical protein CJLB15_00114 [Campylobacter phage CJLB-15]